MQLKLKETKFKYNFRNTFWKEDLERIDLESTAPKKSLAQLFKEHNKKVSFAEVLNSVPKNIQVQLLFHLDLFNHPKNQ